MGQDESKPKKPEVCRPDYHLKDSDPCRNPVCNMAPLVCEVCAYKSKLLVDRGKPALICKLCNVTEEMENYDDSHIDYSKVDVSDIKLVASVSYDRKNHRFDYRGDIA